MEDFCTLLGEDLRDMLLTDLGMKILALLV